MLVIQDSSKPSTVRDALVDVIGETVVDAEVAVAYTTMGGVSLLLDALMNALGKVEFDRIPKTLVTAFDFGITEPDALRCWAALPNSSVRVAIASLLSNSLVPRFAFHPKVYAFGQNAASCGLVVGSANLTSRAFTINTEAIWIERDASRGAVDEVLSNAKTNTLPLSEELLTRYVALRRRAPKILQASVEAEPVPPVASPSSSSVEGLWDAISREDVVPEGCRAMWVQVDSLSGGSRSQLELPRGAHKFFGLQFGDYQAASKKTIGELTLQSGRRVWDGKLLTWHGNNRMERINLPTVSAGGIAYESSAVLFRRLKNGHFELIAAPWESDLAKSWRQASAEAGKLFRLGRGLSKRVVGFLP